MDNQKNRLEGKAFEEVFKNQSQSCGLLCIQNKLTAKHIPGGRMLVEKSNLDFTIANQRGKVAFVDTKSFVGSSFCCSEINPSQVERAVLYNDFSIPSGFVVLFRRDKMVCFYTGKQVQAGHNRSFHPHDGLYLGLLWKFDLSLILDKTT
jgi:hypothetical protein